jgi:hypothetical protein
MYYYLQIKSLILNVTSNTNVTHMRNDNQLTAKLNGESVQSSGFCNLSICNSHAEATLQTGLASLHKLPLGESRMFPQLKDKRGGGGKPSVIPIETELFHLPFSNTLHNPVFHLRNDVWHPFDNSSVT